ncbi:DUF3487 family protein [Thiomicrospira sp.]|uniref:DUF3487 family protein n=1 Tax=Thiomicrospira sp. TaxID=935 RepID=UPI002F9345A5
MDEPVLFASNLDQEPLAYKGATMSEIIMMLKVVPILASFIGFVLGFLLGGLKAAVLGMLISMIVLTMFMVWLLASILVNLKLGKPEGYILQWSAIKLNQFLGFKTGFISQIANWGDMRL